jgi:hypothetical protein
MDTMVMAVRVALLILVTGTFTTLWSGDHPERMASVDRPSKVRIGNRKFSQDNGPREVSQTRTGVESVLSEAFWQPEISLPKAPLPEGIQAGTYLVVDQFGGTGTRVVSAEELTLRDQSTTKFAVDHYSVVVGNARWHYIRIDGAIAERTANLSGSTRLAR